jgi:phage RecT family recombinase
MKLIIPDTNNKEFRALLTGGGEEGVLTLRGYVTPERMTQVALAAIRRTPALLQCRVESLLEALTLCMEAGLEPDGRNAHLLAQGDTVRVVFDWKGLVALGRRRGVEAIHADVVCEHDNFGVGYDGGAKLTHKVDYRNPRGGPYAAYCYYIIEGEPDVEVMTREEIERERAAEAAASGNCSLAQLWEQDWPAMAKRAVVARASLRWPVDIPVATGASTMAPAPPAKEAPHDESAHHHGMAQNGNAKQSPLETLKEFMTAREISEASMLDYLKEEGRIADFVTQLSEVPAPVIEDVVSTWVEMLGETGEM